ncbi:MAG: hypothetical protein LBF15_02280 [Candidatus Peribacteria bacterium]|nr:hypothetical protein [Candidatus Peribacteria bacterium]
MRELIDILNKKKELLVASTFDFKKFKVDNVDSKYDFKYILGQNHAKRALEIAAS